MKFILSYILKFGRKVPLLLDRENGRENEKEIEREKEGNR
jgi:hypothetical protein